MGNALELLHISGTNASAVILLRMHAQAEHSVCEMAAFMYGMQSWEYSLEEIFTAARNALKREE